MVDFIVAAARQVQHGEVRRDLIDEVSWRRRLKSYAYSVSRLQTYSELAVVSCPRKFKEIYHVFVDLFIKQSYHFWFPFFVDRGNDCDQYTIRDGGGLPTSASPAATP